MLYLAKKLRNQSITSMKGFFLLEYSCFTIYVVLVSAVQWSESVIYISIYLLHLGPPSSPISPEIATPMFLHIYLLTIFWNNLSSFSVDIYLRSVWFLFPCSNFKDFNHKIKSFPVHKKRTKLMSNTYSMHTEVFKRCNWWMPLWNE